MKLKNIIMLSFIATSAFSLCTSAYANPPLTTDVYGTEGDDVIEVEFVQSIPFTTYGDIVSGEVQVTINGASVISVDTEGSNTTNPQPNSSNSNHTINIHALGGNDIINFDPGISTWVNLSIYGDDGSDQISALTGLTYTVGPEYGEHALEIHGLDGDDVISCPMAGYTIHGGNGNDQITSTNDFGVSPNKIFGGPDNDTIIISATPPGALLDLDAKCGAGTDTLTLSGFTLQSTVNCETIVP